MSKFKKAVKREVKLRLAITGPSGAGKTYTAAHIAELLADTVAFVDTEDDSFQRCYGDLFPKTSVLELGAPFHPQKYIGALDDAHAEGFGAVVIDSLTHAWSGSGGLLELIDDYMRTNRVRNGLQAWGEFGTPLQQKLMNAILGSKLHTIVCMRSKQTYEIDKDEKTGKTRISKLGLNPQQRGDVEYEFDIVFRMDADNSLVVTKSRCAALAEGTVIRKGDARKTCAKIVGILKPWLAGAPVEPKRSEAPPKPAAGDGGSDVTEAQKSRLRALYKDSRLSDGLRNDIAQSMKANRLNRKTANGLIHACKSDIAPPDGKGYEPEVAA